MSGIALPPSNLRPFGAPPSGGRRENAAFPIAKPFPASSFRAKARNLFRSRSGEAVRSTGNGKHHASCDLGVRCFMQTALRRKTETGNEKDPSAALGMTKRERHIPHSFSIPLRKPTSAPSGYLLPEEGGRIPLPYSKAFSHIVISNESEKSFSFAVRRGCEECGKRETCFM